MKNGLYTRPPETLPTDSGTSELMTAGREVGMTPAQEAEILRDRIEAITSDGALSEHAKKAVDEMKQRLAELDVPENNNL